MQSEKTTDVKRKEAENREFNPLKLQSTLPQLTWRDAAVAWGMEHLEVWEKIGALEQNLLIGRFVRYLPTVQLLKSTDVSADEAKMRIKATCAFIQGEWREWFEVEKQRPRVVMPVISGRGFDDAGYIAWYLEEISKTTLKTFAQEKSFSKRIHLARLLEEKDIWAEDDLVVSNLRLVVSVARKYVDKGLGLGDLINEGNMGLMLGVRKYDWRLGFRFSTYATWLIRQAITRALADQGRAIRLPVPAVELINRAKKVRQEMRGTLNRDISLAELAQKMGVPVEKIQFLYESSREIDSLNRQVGDEEEGGELGEFLEDDRIAVDDIVARRDTRRQVMAALGSLSEKESLVLMYRHGLVDGISWTLEDIGQLPQIGVTRERVRQLQVEAERKLGSPSRVYRLQGLIG